MRNVSVICPHCKELVPVVEKTIQQHGDCPVSGMRYVPSPARIKAGAGGPEFEVLATRPLTAQCDDCHREHIAGIEALIRVNMPDPTVN